MSYGQVDRLAKLVPNHPTDPWTLRARAQRRLRTQRANMTATTEVRRLIDLAMQLEGLPRHSSTHAAGVVIGDRPLDAARAALPRSALGHAGHPVRHEICRGCGAGEVRLPRAQDAVGAAEGGASCWRSAASTIDLDDARRGTTRRSTSCSSRGDTVGVFQLESEGMRRTLAAVKPTDVRRHHRARLALSAGADGQHPAVRPPQERARRRSNIRIRCSRRSWPRPTASSSIRNR